MRHDSNMMPPYQNIEYWIVSVVPYSTSLSTAHADSGNAHPGAVIDNLTATIVCVKILKRVVPHKKAPLYHLYGQIGFNLEHLWRLAAHLSGLASFLWWPYSCGCQCRRWGREDMFGLSFKSWQWQNLHAGAWSPIGDVTTTMLWIRHKISTTGRGVANYWNGLGNTTCNQWKNQQFIHFMGFVPTVHWMSWILFLRFYTVSISMILFLKFAFARHHYLALFPFLCGGGAAIVWHLVAGHQGILASPAVWLSGCDSVTWGQEVCTSRDWGREERAGDLGTEFLRSFWSKLRNLPCEMWSTVPRWLVPSEACFFATDLQLLLLNN